LKWNRRKWIGTGIGIGYFLSGAWIVDGSAGSIERIAWALLILEIEGGSKMKQCGCVAEIEAKARENLKVSEGGISNLELISGRTFSTFSYEETQGKRKRKKETYILHSFCPFCGKPYAK